MHPYFYHRLTQFPLAETATSEIGASTSRAIDLLAVPAGKTLSTGATAVARRAIAVRLAFGPRLTAAQARTISLIETHDIKQAQSIEPGKVLAFKHRKS